jgi:PhnB protein
MANVKAVPEGYHTVTPGLAVERCAEAIELYKKALGAEERSRMVGPGGKIMHAEIKIGDSILMLNDPMPEMGAGPSKSSFYLYVTDCDAWYKRAVAAGFKSIMEPSDMFWGDRYGGTEDPWGNKWGFSTHKEEVAPADMEKRQAEWMKQMASGKKP